MSYEDMYDDAMSAAYGDDWEKYICPIHGPAGQDLCFVERGSEECVNCEKEFMKEVNKNERKRRKKERKNRSQN